MANEPLKVALVGADLRMQKLLQMFLSGPGKGLAIIVPPADAEADMVDLVGVSAPVVWDAYRKRSKRPSIVLSVEDVHSPDAIWVPKPIQKSELVRALQAMSRRCLEKKQAALAAASDVSVALPSAPRRATSGPGAYSFAASKALIDYENEYLCGDYTDVVYQDPAYLTRLFYQTASTLQHWLDRAIRFAEESGRPVMIRGLGQDIVVLSGGKQVFLPYNKAELHHICRRPLPGEGLRMQAMMDDFMVNDGDARVRRSDSILWETALLCSRGRVPHGTNLDQVFTLKQWPNLTRLALTPHAMQLAALWCHKPVSLRESAKLLGIRHRYVYSFYSACAAQDLVARRLFSGGPASEETVAAKPAKPARFSPGFLGRVLEYLVGASR